MNSSTAARAADSSTMVLSAMKVASRAWMARLLMARGSPRLAVWISAAGSSVNSGSVRPARARWVREVVEGLLAGHAVHVVADRDALIQRRQDTELDLAAQGRLPDEQAGERAGGVHLMGGERGRGLFVFTLPVGVLAGQCGVVDPGGQSGGLLIVEQAQVVDPGAPLRGSGRGLFGLGFRMGVPADGLVRSESGIVDRPQAGTVASHALAIVRAASVRQRGNPGPSGRSVRRSVRAAPRLHKPMHW